MNTRSQDNLAAIPPAAGASPASSADNPPRPADTPENGLEAADRWSGGSLGPPAQMIHSEPFGADGQTVPPAGLPKIVKFTALARCGDEIWIENEGQIYRLRKTRQGKLILTK